MIEKNKIHKEMYFMAVIQTNLPDIYVNIMSTISQDCKNYITTIEC